MRDRQTEKKRGGGRGWKTKQEKNSTKISHQSWAEVFLPLSLLCPSFLLDEDFFSSFPPGFELLAVAPASLAPNAREKMHPGNTEELNKVGSKSALWTGWRCSRLWLLLLSTTQTRLICFPRVKVKTRPLIASHRPIALQVCHTC